MPRNRTVYAYGEIRNITFRAEENLPIPPTWYMTRLLEGILCEAQSRYPVEIIAFTFMANHVHLMVRVLNPVDLKQFLQYLKRESAHAVNRLMGRRKKTIWCDGSDKPVVLDMEKVLSSIAYIYCNPAAANLTDSVDEYPGLCSWKMFLTGHYELCSYRIARDAIPNIKGERKPGKHRQLDLISQMEVDTAQRQESTFKLTPYAFLKAFPEAELNEEEVQARIIEKVRVKEEELRITRAKEKKTVLGVTALRLTELDRAHTPKKYGKRMLCLSSCKILRRTYIKACRAVQYAAEEVYIMMKEIGRRLQYPPGVFAPGGSMNVSLWRQSALYL